MSTYSKADPIQIARMTFDEEAEATRVVMVPTEMSMELSAEDGDSILAHPVMQVLEVEAGQIVDTSKARRVMSVVDEVVITAVILSTEVPMYMLNSMLPSEICVPAIKCSKATTLILQS
jgi:hypothetical protein